MSAVASKAYVDSKIGTSTTGFTSEGGVYVTLVNKTGANSVKGTIVAASTTVDKAVRVAPANFDQPIGIVYDNGVPDGGNIKVVVAGNAEVLLKNGETSTRSYWCGVSDVAGRAYQVISPPSTTEHNREIGHSLESKASGTNVLFLANLHFN